VRAQCLQSFPFCFHKYGVIMKTAELLLALLDEGYEKKTCGTDQISNKR
jgi:hypothetical protein